MFGDCGEESDVDYGSVATIAYDAAQEDIKELKAQLKKLWSTGVSFLALIEGELSPPSDMYEDHNYYEFEFALDDTKKLLGSL